MRAQGLHYLLFNLEVADRSRLYTLPAGDPRMSPHKASLNTNQKSSTGNKGCFAELMHKPRAGCVLAQLFQGQIAVDHMLCIPTELSVRRSEGKSSSVTKMMKGVCASPSYPDVLVGA